jgi:hypothetical protein
MHAQPQHAPVFIAIARGWPEQNTPRSLAEPRGVGEDKRVLLLADSVQRRARWRTIPHSTSTFFLSGLYRRLWLGSR